MNKKFCLIFALFMMIILVSLAGCKGKNPNGRDTDTGTVSDTVTSDSPSDTADPSSDTESDTDTGEVPTGGPEDTTKTPPDTTTKKPDETTKAPPDTTTNSGTAKPKDPVAEISDDENATVDVLWTVPNQPLQVVGIGRYKGLYMEDYSDAFIIDALKIVVKNTSDVALEYAEITIKAGGKTATFEITALPAKKTAIVLEKTGVLFDKSLKYSLKSITATYFTGGRYSLYKDVFSVTAKDNNRIVIKNISDKDITGEIYVYYKTVENGVYIGGITYRAKVPVGLKAGAEHEMRSNHFIKDKSEILFISYMYVE